MVSTCSARLVGIGSGACSCTAFLKGGNPVRMTQLVDLLHSLIEAGLESGGKVGRICPVFLHSPPVRGMLVL